MDLSQHPLYRDESAVRQITEWHLSQGRSVFQLFQFPGGELEHSLRLLALIDPPHVARVLSLGSGVGGMERYWQVARPDLSFELVNVAQPQLDLCRCEGAHVLADADGYISSSGRFDVVLLAYMLGHVDVAATLDSALANLKSGGALVVFDVFDSTQEFDAAFCYESPALAEVERFSVEHGLRSQLIERDLESCSYVRDEVPAALLRQTQPALFILRGSNA
jgi:hypothetical protein